MLGFVYGLVIPEEFDVSEQCTTGVARVETKLSFMNRVVYLLTGGIFTPMHVTVTCAEGSDTAEAEVIQSGQQDVEKAFETAARHAQLKKQPVYVQFAE